MTRFKSLFSIFLTAAVVGLSTVCAVAQSPAPPVGPAVNYAYQYGQWGLVGQAPNTYVFFGKSTCNQSANGTTFFPFATNAPVYIADAITANSEVDTPSAVVLSGSNCGITVSTTYTHNSFTLRSGTGGLQEALNTLPTGGAYPAAITLDRNWYAQAGSVPGTTPAAILTAAKGSARIFLIDVTTAGPTFYVWGGTSYVSGTWVNTVPTAAAGTAAGTSPTISDTGTALATNVALTAGTSTTTGTLFTLTWATSAQFTYAPTGCVVSSSGTNSFTAFTTATTYTSSHAVLTVTATTAPTASTAYAFTVSGCK